MAKEAPPLERISLEEAEAFVKMMKRHGLRYLQVSGLTVAIDDVLESKGVASVVGFDASRAGPEVDED